MGGGCHRLVLSAAAAERSVGTPLVGQGCGSSRHERAIQDLAYARHEPARRERLAQKFYLSLRDAAPQRRIVGVAGDEQHAYVWTELRDPLCDLAAAAVR